MFYNFNKSLKAGLGVLYLETGSGFEQFIFIPYIDWRINNKWFVDMTSPIRFLVGKNLGKNNATHLEVLQAGVHLGKELRVATKKIDLKVHEKNHFARGSHQQLNIVESTSSSLMTHC